MARTITKYVTIRVDVKVADDCELNGDEVFDTLDFDVIGHDDESGFIDEVTVDYFEVIGYDDEYNG